MNSVNFDVEYFEAISSASLMSSVIIIDDYILNTKLKREHKRS
jgi:hypothetical protein